MNGRRLLQHGWRHHAAAATILAAASMAAYLLGAAFAARWWSRLAAHAVDGEPPTGAVLGFCCGTVFALVPATLAWVVTRALIPWTTRTLWLVIAVLLSAPNLLTLSTTTGTTTGFIDSTAVAQRTMDTGAPMFRGATLTGAACALLILLTLTIAFRYRRIHWHRPA
jgi:hypothetical protein